MLLNGRAERAKCQLEMTRKRTQGRMPEIKPSALISFKVSDTKTRDRMKGAIPFFSQLQEYSHANNSSSPLLASLFK